MIDQAERLREMIITSLLLDTEDRARLLGRLSRMSYEQVSFALKIFSEERTYFTAIEKKIGKEEFLKHIDAALAAHTKLVTQQIDTKMHHFLTT